MSYTPIVHGADCLNCPLSKLQNWRPVAPTIQQRAIAQIIGPSPHMKASWGNTQGPLMDKVWTVLAKAGLPKDKVNFMYRTTCVVPNKGLLKKQKTKAAKCCAGHLQKFYDPKLPTLFLGVDTTAGILTLEERMRFEYCLEYGNPVMVVDYLANPYMSKPGKAPFFEELITRWAEAVLGNYTPEPWPEIVIEVSEHSLKALKSMGPQVGWDIETQGTDPLVVPTTCIGVSDNDKAVCIPWDPYMSKNWGPVKGILDYGEIGKAHFDAMIELLTRPRSERTYFTQNGNYDVTGLLPKGYPVRNDIDIYNLHALMFPAMGHDLETIARHAMKLDHRWKLSYQKGLRLRYNTDKKTHVKYEGGHPLDLRDYCARDCYATLVSGQRMLNVIHGL
jgi:hypothetical protein